MRQNKSTAARLPTLTKNRTRLHRWQDRLAWWVLLLLLAFLTGAQITWGQLNSVSVSHYPDVQRCVSGAPPQWQPYLDTASKAHLAPGVALATLHHYNLTPIQLTGNNQPPPANMHHQQTPQMVYHAQNANNVGVIIEADFTVTRVLKRSLALSLRQSQSIRLLYRVGASLSTTNALMNLANGHQHHSEAMVQFQRYQHHQQPHLQQQQQRQQQQIRQLMQRHRSDTCALDLGENELVKKAAKLFKLNETYILFLNQGNALSQNQHQQVSGGGLHWTYDIPPQPFASHELLSNKSGRALRKILCKSCAQVPQVHLVNVTQVADRSLLKPEAPAEQSSRTIRLDCRVTGYPTPWVHWFRNGKLLRNRPGRQIIKTSQWRKRHDVRLSRLELQLSAAGRNETGIYECRAMNVAAREPAVGTYTLLVQPAHYALIPMQPVEAAAVTRRPGLAGGSSAAPPTKTTPATTPTLMHTATQATTTTTTSTTPAPQTTTTATPPPATTTTTSGTTSSPMSTTTTDNEAIAHTTTTTSGPASNSKARDESNLLDSTNSIQPVAGQPCPREAHDNFCLNKGTCVLIGHIEEYFCKTNKQNYLTYYNLANCYLLPTRTAPANFEHKFVVIQAKLGDSIKLECNATGDQPIQIDWFREGNNATIEKHGNDLYDIHESPMEGAYGLSSFMQIRAVKTDDGLLYKCLARNEFGFSERLIKLIVLGVPERPAQLRVRDIWSRSALVSWQAQLSGSQAPVRVSNYTVQYWRKNSLLGVAMQNHRREEISVDGLQSSALLVNLLPAITYEVSVIAHNQVGRSEPSEPVNVTTSEEEPSAPPTDVQVEPRGSSSLRVTWKVPPAESLNGRLLGFYVGYRPRPAAAGLHQAALSLPYGGQQQQAAAIVAQQQQQPVFSYKTVDANEGQIHYDTFVGGLRHNQDYEVAVRAFNKAGSGPDCHLVAARTNSARLPPAPVLQVQRVAQNAVTLRWTSSVALTRTQGGLPIGSSIPQQQQLEPPRYVLYYQLQGERDWYELTVLGGQHDSAAVSSSNILEQQQQPISVNQQQVMSNQVAGKLPIAELIDGSASSQLNANELVTSQANVHTLSNLQPGVVYRIYVAAANDFGLGDPSNVVSVRTDPPPNAPNGGTLPGQQLDLSAGGGGGLLDVGSTWAWSGGGAPGGPGGSGQLLYTLMSSASLLGLVLLLIGLLVWQQRRRRQRLHLRHSGASSAKYNASSSGGSSYPSSWITPTIPGEPEYSVSAAGKRYAQQAASGSTLAYDDLVSRHRQRLQQQQQQLQSTATTRPISQQQMLRKQSRQTVALSSHYYQPADLISGCPAAGTLQLQPKRSANQNAAAATLNRNQNRQLPPIPYSTLSVKEMNQSSGKQNWRQQSAPPGQQQQSQQQEYRMQQPSNGGGSQTPLIYGVIE